MKDTITGPRPYAINYIKVNGQWTRYTLAFLAHQQWALRNRNNHKRIGATGYLPPRNYNTWPVFCAAGTL